MKKEINKNMKKEIKYDSEFTEKLSEMTTKIFGWNSEYYLTELENIKDCIDEEDLNVRTIKDRINVNVLISDDFDFKNIPMLVDIRIKDFPDDKKPQKGDIIFFNDINKFYTVESYTKKDRFFRLNIHPYQIKTQTSSKDIPLKF